MGNKSSRAFIVTGKRPGGLDNGSAPAWIPGQINIFSGEEGRLKCSAERVFYFFRGTGKGPETKKCPWLAEEGSQPGALLL